MCDHRLIEVKTERDRCSWVRCMSCGMTGPKKHSYTLALLAWILRLRDQYPRPKKPRKKTRTRRRS